MNLARVGLVFWFADTPVGLRVHGALLAKGIRARSGTRTKVA